MLLQPEQRLKLLPVRKAHADVCVPLKQHCGPSLCGDGGNASVQLLGLPGTRTGTPWRNPPGATMAASPAAWAVHGGDENDIG